jgi:hypothetical protein
LAFFVDTGPCASGSRWKKTRTDAAAIRLPKCQTRSDDVVESKYFWQATPLYPDID